MLPILAASPLVVPSGQCLTCPLAAALLPALAAGMPALLPVPVLLVADEDEVTLARLMTVFGIPASHADRFRKRLERWRGCHAVGWSQILERQHGQALYRYGVGAARPVAIALLADVSTGLLKPGDF